VTTNLTYAAEAASSQTLEALAQVIRALAPEVSAVSFHDFAADTLWLSEDFLLPEDHQLVEDSISSDSGGSLEVAYAPREDGTYSIAIPVRDPNGAINGAVLLKLGMSLPLVINLLQPWRFVMAVFLHGSLLHIAFNMWILMDLGPQVEEMYGSARYLFIYVATGIGGYLLSSLFGHYAIGGSGAILGICGVIIAVTAGSRSIGHQMLRAQVMRLLIYIVVIAILPFGFLGNIDNLAHIGGFASGFGLGKIMVDRAPSSPDEWKRANLLGWATGLVVAASLGMVAFGIFRAS